MAATEPATNGDPGSPLCSLPGDVREVVWESLSQRAACVLSCVCRTLNRELAYVVAWRKAENLIYTFDEYVGRGAVLQPRGLRPASPPFVLDVRKAKPRKGTLFWSYVVLVDGQVELRDDEEEGAGTIAVLPSFVAPSDALTAQTWMPLVLARFACRSSLLGRAFRSAHFDFEPPPERVAETPSAHRWSRRALQYRGPTIVYPTYVGVTALYSWKTGTEMKLVGRMPLSALAEKVCRVAEAKQGEDGRRHSFEKEAMLVAWRSVSVSVRVVPPT